MTTTPTPLNTLATNGEDWTLTKEDDHIFAACFAVTRYRQQAFPYMNMRFIEGTTNHITIAYTSHNVSIDGDGLMPLFEEIAAHRVKSVRLGKLVMSIEVSDRNADEEE
jgi:hypothetical protein